MREAVHLLRPADRDRDPAGPVPGRLLVGHIDDREAAEVLLGLDVRPVGEDGRAAAAVDASRPPSLKTKTPASVISSIKALPEVALSRSSSIVRSGTHSSLKAIRYSAISGSFAQGAAQRTAAHPLHERTRADRTAGRAIVSRLSAPQPAESRSQRYGFRRG